MHGGPSLTGAYGPDRVEGHADVLGLTHTLLAYTRQDFVRVRDSYASLLVLLLANFFRLELDRRES